MPSDSLPQLRAEPSDALIDRFTARFGRRPELAARAPGRVNLIGEHTDYNGGLVLPCAIDRSTWVLCARRQDGLVQVHAADFDSDASFAASQPLLAGGFVDYVQGAVFALGRRGVSPVGLDMLIASELPQGAGLSSSAALEVACVAAFAAASGADLSRRDVAEVAHVAESEFVGVPCGILDPFASALGRAGAALRIDCLTREVRLVALPAAGFALLVAHSGVTHRLASPGDGYATRVAECQAALLAAKQHGLVEPGATSLRSLGDSALAGLEAQGDWLLARRVRHLIRENERVEAACEGFECDDLDAVGTLLCESQASLRDDYQVSIPELDALCEIGDALPGVYGSRLIGAGFGGCSMHLVAEPSAASVSSALGRAFQERFGRRPVITAVAASDGASLGWL